MSLCACPKGPRCEAYNGACGPQRADWTCMVPLSWKPPLRLGPKFFCNECLERFKKAWRTPMKGIDRPPDADEDWRGSLLDHIRHAQIAIAFDERNNAGVFVNSDLSRPSDSKRYTPAQLQQVYILRRYHLQYGAHR